MKDLSQWVLWRMKDMFWYSLTADNIVTITSKPTFTKLILRVYLRGTENKAERMFVLSTIYIICGIQTRRQVDANCYASIIVIFCLFKYIISVRQDLVAASYGCHWLLYFVETQYLGLFHFRDVSLCSLNSVDSCALANRTKLCVWAVWSISGDGPRMMDLCMCCQTTETRSWCPKLRSWTATFNHNSCNCVSVTVSHRHSPSMMYESYCNTNEWKASEFTPAPSLRLRWCDRYGADLTCYDPRHCFRIWGPLRLLYQDYGFLWHGAYSLVNMDTNIRHNTPEDHNLDISFPFWHCFNFTLRKIHSHAD